MRGWRVYSLVAVAAAIGGWCAAQGSVKQMTVRVLNRTGRTLSLRAGALEGSGRWLVKPAASVPDAGEGVARFTADSPITGSLTYEIPGAGRVTIRWQGGPGGISALDSAAPAGITAEAIASADSAAVLIAAGSSRGLFDKIKKGLEKAGDKIKGGAEKTTQGIKTGANETKNSLVKVGDVLSPAFARVCQDYYCSEGAPKTWATSANRRWMEKLDPQAALTSLTIPGTHDSGALHGGPLIECQSWSIREQLDAGIRFLDVRCRHIQNTFAIHHGLKFQNQYFGDVLKACTGFLEAYPSETIVMRVKEEYNASGNSRTFAQTFDDYRQKSARYWYTENRVPTLGEARGKIVLVTQHGDHGIPWGNLNIQDDYDVPTVFHLNKKWNKVRDKLVEARSGPAATWYVNFCSGSSGGCYPYTVATAVNPSALNFINNRPARWGMVVMDFPGERLIDALIRTNSVRTK